MNLIDVYIENKSLELSPSILSRKTIYLDLKYWILLQEQNKAGYPHSKEILNFCIELVNEGKCLFPISEIIFLEIFKQADPRSRNATLLLVEKLSGDIAIVNDENKIKIEFIHWLRVAQNKPTPKLKQLIWSKLPLVVGYLFLSNMGKLINGTQELQSFFDFMTNFPLLDAIANVFPHSEPLICKDDIVSLNANKELYKHENKTFHELFLSELAGFIDCFTNLFDEAMELVYYKDTGKIASPEEKRSFDSEQCRNLIYHAFAMDKIGDELPMFRIFPELFASFRWNTQRKYKDGNDTFDVKHACCALPYFDFFFTENQIHSIIKQRKLDQRYGCIVESKSDKVLEILKSI